MEEQPKKLCPFSLSFAHAAPSAVAGLDGKKPSTIKLGWPCIAHNCMWWDKETKDCVIFGIQGYLNEIVKKHYAA